MNFSNHKYFKVSLKCFDEWRNANDTSRCRWLEIGCGGRLSEKFLLQNWFSRQITLVSKSDILLILQRRQDENYNTLSLQNLNRPTPPAKLVG